MIQSGYADFIIISLESAANIPAAGIARLAVIVHDVPVLPPPQNLRNMPSMGGDIIGSIPNGAAVQILGRWQDWYVWPL